MYGKLKNRHAEAIVRGWTRVGGLAGVTLMFWAATAHYNLLLASRDEPHRDWGFVELPPPAALAS